MKLERSSRPDRHGRRGCAGAHRLWQRRQHRRWRRGRVRGPPRRAGARRPLSARVLGAEERHGRVRLGLHRGLPGQGQDVNVDYNPSGSGDGAQPVHRQADRLRRFRLGAQGRPGRPGRTALRRATRPGTCRWSSARSRWPTTSTASTISCSTARPRRGSSTARSPPGTTRRSPRSTRASSCPTAPITVFFRSDASGTTDNFQQYLGRRVQRRLDQGRGPRLQGRRRSGREGPAGRRAGRRERHRAPSPTSRRRSPTQNELKAAAIDTGSGPVELSTETASKSIESAKFSRRAAATSPWT